MAKKPNDTDTPEGSPPPATPPTTFLHPDGFGSYRAFTRQEEADNWKPPPPVTQAETDADYEAFLAKQRALLEQPRREERLPVDWISRDFGWDDATAEAFVRDVPIDQLALRITAAAEGATRRGRPGMSRAHQAQLVSFIKRARRLAEERKRKLTELTQKENEPPSQEPPPASSPPHALAEDVGKTDGEQTARARWALTKISSWNTYGVGALTNKINEVLFGEDGIKDGMHIGRHVSKDVVRELVKQIKKMAQSQQP